MNRACFLLLVSAMLLLTACNKANKEQQVGNLYYYSRFDEQSRMHIRDGMDLIFYYLLAHHQSPEREHGKNLHLSFTDINLLKEGAEYQLPHPAIKAVVSEWAIPAEFKLNRGIKGKLRIKKIQPFQVVVMDLDLELQTGLQEFETYKYSNVEFQVNRLHRNHSKTDVSLETSDRNYADLQAADLQGHWVQKAEIFYDKTLGWRSYFHIPEPIIWEIKKEDTLQLNNQPIKIEQGRLLFKDSNGIEQFYAINHFSTDSLVVTNLNAIQHNRYTFIRE